MISWVRHNVSSVRSSMHVDLLNWASKIQSRTDALSNNRTPSAPSIHFLPSVWALGIGTAVYEEMPTPPFPRLPLPLLWWDTKEVEGVSPQATKRRPKTYMLKRLWLLAGLGRPWHSPRKARGWWLSRGLGISIDCCPSDLDPDKQQRMDGWIFIYYPDHFYQRHNCVTVTQRMF